jgi:AraC family transcriptional regulator of adaptative response / methylphosphotriester-DNA alkyltransferase methyltransferase
LNTIKPIRAKEITETYFSYLDTHVNDVVSGVVECFMEINEIADKIFISHNHLTNTIQQETGHHPCYFYDQKIIDKAKEMLLKNDKSIAAIARILTYDPSNFTKFFKKLTGLTPGQYRLTNKINAY